MSDTPERLKRLKNYATRYEIVATCGDRRILAGYTRRNNRSGLFSTLRQYGKHWLKLTGHENVVYGKKASDGVTIGEWKINFSGRTQRCAIVGGELPFICDEVKL